MIIGVLTKLLTQNVSRDGDFGSFPYASRLDARVCRQQSPSRGTDLRYVLQRTVPYLLDVV